MPVSVPRSRASGGTLALVLLMVGSGPRADEEPTAVRVTAPAAEERAASGAEVVVLFAAEPGRRVGAWELRPDQAEAAPVRRCEFASSDWAPDLVFREEPAAAPELVRFQCGSGGVPPGYRVSLFRIDYRTWEVLPLLVARQVQGIAACPDFAYLAVPEGVRLFDRGSLVLRPVVPELHPLRIWTDTWLVELPDGGSGLRTGALFEPRRELLLAPEFELPAEWDDEWELILSPTRAHLAALDLYFRDDPSAEQLGFGETRILTTALTVRQVGSTKVHRRSIGVECAGGSGRRFIPIGLEVAFAADGRRLRVTNARRTAGGGVDLRRLTLDVDSGEVTADEAAAARAPAATPAAPGRAVPDWLRADYDRLEGKASEEGGRRLVHAFLARQGLSCVPVAVLSTRLAFSPDGGRALVHMLDPQAPTDFLLCDFARRELRRIPCPPELRVPDLNVYWIRLP